MPTPFLNPRKLWTFLALVCILAASALPVAAITGGTDDGNDHPNVGAIVIGPWNWYIICTGTLVSPTVFLTAGHCTDALDEWIAAGYIVAGDVYVNLNSGNAAQGSGSIQVSEVKTHPDYKPNPGGMGIGVPDIGALILATEVVDIEPAKLAGAGYLDELWKSGSLRKRGQPAEFTVVGYGTTLLWPPPVIVDPDGSRDRAQSEFLNLRHDWLNLSQNQAPGNENGGTGYGDSGGPTFWNEDGEEILVAICSWGDMMTVATGTAWRVDTEVSQAFLRGLNVLP